MRRIIFFILILFSFSVIAQSNLFIPVSINSPMFKSDTLHETQLGTKLSNYASIVYFANQKKNRIVTLITMQFNNGNLKLDPLNFNKYYEQGQEKHIIESYPQKHFYLEYALGKNYHHKTQKISLAVGLGQQFIQSNTRIFGQLDWGNESEVVIAGVSLRGNLTSINGRIRTVIETTIQGKLKLGKLRVTHQFGYSFEPEINKVIIPLANNKLRTAYRININCMKPTITFGVEYAL